MKKRDEVDAEADRIYYRQGQSIVEPMSTPYLLRFAAGVLREKVPDPYNKALADELCKRADESESPAADWTIDPATNRSNSSPRFVRLVHEVEQLIRGQAHTLIAGRAEQTAGLILAQLVHKHGLAPSKPRP